MKGSGKAFQANRGHASYARMQGAETAPPASLPLAGRDAGRQGGGKAKEFALVTSANPDTTPTPDPSPQGGGERRLQPFSRPAVIGSLLAGLAAFVLDRGHKLVQLELMGWRDLCPPPATTPLCPYRTVLPVFDYVLVWNPGISYGLLQDVPTYVLLAMMLVATGLLVWWWLKAQTVLTRYGLAICIGGAASHLFDRMIYGAVPDFLLFHWQSWSFYVFNLSDAAITIGVILLLIDMVLPQRGS
jgi:signal peptidase II